MKKIMFGCKYSPGDLLMLTVAIRDIHLNYPYKFETDVFSYYPEIFYNNPFITKLSKDNILHVNLDYGDYLKIMRREGFHFSDCFIKMFNDILDLNIKKTSEFPFISLTEEEKQISYIFNKFKLKNKYWILSPGIKNDIPLKGYPPDQYQKLVDFLIYDNNFNYDIVQVGHSNFINPRLKNVINLTGKTDNIRDFFSLIYHSQGTIGPVSFHMHLSAAMNKPSVIIAGGREEVNWEKYSNHIFLHSIGQFDCCKEFGCWKSFPYECKNHVNDSIYPKCMSCISPETIVKSILSFC